MPEQFVVPQFIDAEAKIIGPVTARQFVILLVTAGIDGFAYALFDKTLFIIATLPIAGLGLVIAFVKINGQDFHFFLLNILMTFRKPKLRVWGKDVSPAYLRQFIERPAPPPPKVSMQKDFVHASRLNELSLMVNTGGVYKPEDHELN